MAEGCRSWHQGCRSLRASVHVCATQWCYAYTPACMRCMHMHAHASTRTRCSGRPRYICMRTCTCTLTRRLRPPLGHGEQTPPDVPWSPRLAPPAHWVEAPCVYSPWPGAHAAHNCKTWVRSMGRQGWWHTTRLDSLAHSFAHMCAHAYGRATPPVPRFVVQHSVFCGLATLCLMHRLHTLWPALVDTELPGHATHG